MSTRRPYALADDAGRMNFNSTRLSSHELTRRVPFLWERAPGVPKDGLRGLHSHVKEAKIMPPKPPPGRWRPSAENNGCNTSKFDSGNDGDVDDWSTDGSDGVYSDALDKLSLSRSSGIGCRISMEQPSYIDQYKTPNFIMDRFLPAANALAAASSLGINPKYSKQAAPSYSHRLQREIDMFVPTHRLTTTDTQKSRIHTNPCIEARPPRSPALKTCGIMPWSLKSRVCGYKSPVRSQTPRASLDHGLRIRTKRCVSDGLSSETDGVMSTRARRSSVGWGFPFLDTSRLRLRGSSVDGGKWKDFIVGRKSESGSERSMKRTVAERGGAACSLPQLKGPSDPWLSSHAVNSVNRR